MMVYTANPSWDYTHAVKLQGAPLFFFGLFVQSQTILDRHGGAHLYSQYLGVPAENQELKCSLCYIANSKLS